MPIWTSGELDAHRKENARRKQAAVERAARWAEHICPSNWIMTRRSRWAALCAGNTGPVDLYSEQPPLPPLPQDYLPVVADEVNLQWLRQTVCPEIRSFQMVAVASATPQLGGDGAPQSRGDSSLTSELHRVILHYMERECRMFQEHGMGRPLVLEWLAPTSLAGDDQDAAPLLLSMTFTAQGWPELLGLKLGPSPCGRAELVSMMRGSYAAKLSQGQSRRGDVNLRPGFILKKIGTVDVSAMSFEEVSGQPASVIVKMAGATESKRRLAYQLGAYEKEKLACAAALRGVLGVRTPRVYGCFADAGARVLTMVMEDLQRRGTEYHSSSSAVSSVPSSLWAQPNCCGKSVVLSYDGVKSLVRDLAKLAGSTWNHPLLTDPVLAPDAKRIKWPLAFAQKTIEGFVLHPLLASRGREALWLEGDGLDLQLSKFLQLCREVLGRDHLLPGDTYALEFWLSLSGYCDANRHMEVHERLWRRLEDCPYRCLNHGDGNATNVFSTRSEPTMKVATEHEPAERELTWIDWQCCHTSVPGMDLAALLTKVLVDYPSPDPEGRYYSNRSKAADYGVHLYTKEAQEDLLNLFHAEVLACAPPGAAEAFTLVRLREEFTIGVIAWYEAHVGLAMDAFNAPELAANKVALFQHTLLRNKLMIETLRADKYLIHLMEPQST